MSALLDAPAVRVDTLHPMLGVQVGGVARHPLDKLVVRTRRTRCRNVPRRACAMLIPPAHDLDDGTKRVSALSARRTKVVGGVDDH
ncbi:hypothetical protein ACLF3G_28950 [Falsiroseomonas sp. HC035]|uniref:hypothetical protein n=1 Tax=Falsiroseomonas sp. HC035 TaxID=3390999 RepID=UPI003D311B86